MTPRFEAFIFVCGTFAGSATWGRGGSDCDQYRFDCDRSTRAQARASRGTFCRKRMRKRTSAWLGAGRREMMEAQSVIVMSSFTHS